MARNFRAWLRRKLEFRGKTRRRACDPSKPETAAHPSTPISKQQNDSPPPYDTLDLPPRSRVIFDFQSGIDGSESLEVLRARNPAITPPSDTRPILRPPREAAQLNVAADLAGLAAVDGMIRALDETNPRMVAARTAQAISMAVSTSRSYAAFVAAVTAVESSALLLVEGGRDECLDEVGRERQANALSAATNVAMAADAGIAPLGLWLFNIHDTDNQKGLLFI
ncbi:hypothetical protein DHEL01_v203644 [Diaporthe helianthi]|uniref:Uncharacterized protein n=1 Tax=Diaporthe helianthi TaxID=158607 RepID=A0A2P5I619_DIAHE|nr:hypothetical protein DHEL01_v203644 [Diaporthe helianthi]